MRSVLYTLLVVSAVFAVQAAVAGDEIVVADAPKPGQGNGLALGVNTKPNPADQLENDIGPVDLGASLLEEEPTTSWSGVAPNLGGVYFRYEGPKLMNIELGGLANWAAIFQGPNGGVQSKIGRVSANGTCNESGQKAIQYENILKRYDYTLVGVPAEERSAQNPLGASVATSTDAPPVEYCESGTLNSAKFTFTSSEDLTCKPSITGVPMDVQTSFTTFGAPPLGCVNVLPKIKDYKEKEGRVLYPDFVNKGVPATHYGFWVSETDQSATIQTPEAFAAMNINKGVLINAQGVFLTHECIDEYTARSVRERVSLKPDGTTKVWNRGCEVTVYDPATKIRKVWTSSTENVCPPAEPVPPPSENDLWNYKEYKHVGDLPNGPAIGKCTGAKGVAWVPEIVLADAPSPIAGSATIGGAFGDSAPGPAPKPKPAPTPSAASTVSVGFGALVAIVLAGFF